MVGGEREGKGRGGGGGGGDRDRQTGRHTDRDNKTKRTDRQVGMQR